MEKTKPLISVVIPIYNIERFIGESLDSVLNQSFKDFEIILIENGSTDNTMKIAKKYQKKDKRIVIETISEPDVQKAMNKGFEIARGKYIARMDADDICLPNRFKIQFNYLEKNPHIFLIGTSAMIIDEYGEKIGVFRKQDNYKKLKKRILKSNPFIHPSIMFRNTKEAFYREKFRCSEDYDMYLRLLTSEKNLTNLPDILIKYRVRKGSFMSTKPNQSFFFQKAKEFYSQRKQIGKDDYENLLPPLKNTDLPDFDKSNLSIKILSEFQDNQMKNVRIDIKDYFRRYGFDKSLGMYYLSSFLPYNLIFLLRKIFP